MDSNGVPLDAKNLSQDKWQTIGKEVGRGCGQVVFADDNQKVKKYAYCYQGHWEQNILMKDYQKWSSIVAYSEWKTDVDGYKLIQQEKVDVDKVIRNEDIAAYVRNIIDEEYFIVDMKCNFFGWTYDSYDAWLQSLYRFQWGISLCGKIKLYDFT